MEGSLTKNIGSPFPHTIVLGGGPNDGDVAFVSINSIGRPGNANLRIMEQLKYDRKSFPTEKDLSDGYYYLRSEGKKPVVFIVTFKPGTRPATNLFNNLIKAISGLRPSLNGKKVWIPLMGTSPEGGKLALEESYRITLEAIRKTDGVGASQLIISMPEDRGEKLFRSIGSDTPSSQPPPNIDLSAQKKANAPSINYWILKFDLKRWASGFREGGFAYYHTHQPDLSPRSEYDRFTQIRPQDLALACDISGKPRIVGIFEVRDGISKAKPENEVILLTIKEIFTDPVDVASDMDRRLNSELSSSSPIRLIQVDQVTFETLSKGNKLAGPPDPIPANGRKYINPNYLTEGNHAKTADKLKFEDDIESIARVIALRSVNPPLAIGLFGHWGSGKSFFMQKLQTRIDELKGTSEREYVSSVVHVRFNSWHYSDANLWACLITELFDSLNNACTADKEQNELKRLNHTLQITGVEKEEAEKKARDLSLRLETLQKQQARRRSRLEDLSGLKILKLVLSDKKVKEDLSELRNENIEKIITDGKELGEYINYVEESRNKFSEGLTILKGIRGWRGVAIVLLAIAIGVFAVWLSLNQNVWLKITSWGAAASMMFGVLKTHSKKILQNFNEAYDRLKSLDTTIKGRPDEVPAELKVEVARLNELRNSLNALNKTINDTRTQIHDILSGRKLKEFIDQRVNDENYAKQLGLISWIRRDFNKLDELLRKQHEKDLPQEERDKIFNPEHVTLRIDRIILYIDDLDRCNEEIVVKVLEAVHLLLAFPLFVVIVGVDPRWLNNALHKKYKTLLGDAKNNDRDEKREPGMKNRVETDHRKQEMTEEELILSGVATTYDYLEKIFQIPFTLKPIQHDARKELIKYLMESEMEKEPPSSSDEEEHKNLADDDNKIDVPDKKQPHKDDRSDGSGVEQVIQNDEKDKVVTQVNPMNKEVLSFTQGELEYMQTVSGIFGHTPRSINRFVNIYRIIKSHNSFEVNGSFSSKDYVPVMAILSIVVGYSVFAQELIDALNDPVYDDASSFSDFIAKAAVSPKLKNVLKTGIGADALEMTIGLYRKNIALVSRFSFRTINVNTEGD